MKRLVALSAALCLATPTLAQEVLTNELVVALNSAGLGEQTIVAKIKASPSTFDTDAEKLIALKRQGISDAVIAAMVEASSRSQFSSAAMGASDSPDPRAPHASGIYLLASEATPVKMVRIDATSSNQTKTGGMLGYALTGGIAKIKINTVVPGSSARVRTPAARPKFYFYFDQASSGLSGGAPGGFWLAGPASPVTSPNEFSLVRFNVKKDRREAAVGSFNLGGAKAGVQDNQRVPMTYVDVRPGVFEVTPQRDLPPGEYGFVYSSSTGGGIGMNAAGATMSRIFDFSVERVGGEESKKS
jgi:hypothetical protein